uniref:Maturase K n=1 Tax=Cannabis sativa TaxID=3483 RepID=A0A803QVA4_CANSA
MRGLYNERYKGFFNHNNLRFLPKIIESLYVLLESGVDIEPRIEQISTSWSYIMMYLSSSLLYLCLYTCSKD